MRAVVYERYGPPEVLELRDLPAPVPGEGEVVVRVRATGLNKFDWRLLTADPPVLVRLFAGLRAPRDRVLGADVAGVVEAIGAGVARLRPGDEVYGDLASCGIGGLAELALAREDVLSRKPRNLSFEEAAAVPMAALTALQGLRDAGELRPGHRVLIQGASGGVGTFAIQLAKALGAGHVTAVASAGRRDLALSLGADQFVDYATEDWTRSGLRYDLILGVNGYVPITRSRASLAPAGVYAMVGGDNAQLFQALLFAKVLSSRGGRRLRAVTAKTNAKDLELLTGLVEAGKVRPILERTYAMAEVREAFRHLGEGHVRGKLVVTIS